MLYGPPFVFLCMHSMFARHATYQSRCLHMPQTAASAAVSCRYQERPSHQWLSGSERRMGHHLDVSPWSCISTFATGTLHMSCSDLCTNSTLAVRRTYFTKKADGGHHRRAITACIRQHCNPHLVLLTVKLNLVGAICTTRKGLSIQPYKHKCMQCMQLSACTRHHDVTQHVKRSQSAPVWVGLSKHVEAERRVADIALDRVPLNAPSAFND